MSQKLENQIGIRPWSNDDFPLIVRLMGDPVMTSHLGGPEPLEKLRQRHERYTRIGDSGKGCMFVIIAGPDNIAVGSVGYWEKVWQDQVVWETGWSVLPEFQGKGFATRATAAVIAKARSEAKHRFIHAYPPVTNLPSNAICRKLGFTLQGEYEFEFPPGNIMRCNDWYWDLFAEVPE